MLPSTLPSSGYTGTASSSAIVAGMAVRSPVFSPGIPA